MVDVRHMEDTDKNDTFGLKWANAPTLEDLKRDVTEAQDAHNRHVTEVDNWLSSRDGKQKIKTKVGRSKIVPKVIRKQAEWRYPSLSDPFLSTDDVFNVAPNTFEDKDSAKQNAMVLNYQFNHQLDKVSFIDEYVRACVDEGTVIVELGWETESKIMDVEVPVYGLHPETGQQIQTGVKLERKEVDFKNQPTLEVCHYGNTIVDPTCEGDLRKAEFVIRSFETSKSDLKKDGRYKNIDKIVIDSSDSLTDSEFESQDDSNFKFQDDARKKFVVYRYFGYWDIDGDGETKSIIAAWAGNTLIRLEETPFPDGRLPFVLVQLLPRRKKVYGEPDGALIEDNQRIVGAVTRGVLDVMGRSANGQVGMKKNALDVVNARKFERGDDYKYNDNVDPKTAFYMGTYPEVPRIAMDMIGYQNNEAESLTGIKAFNTGISGNSLGASVGGARLATDATAKRELNILRRLANGIIKIGRKIISMNQEMLSDETILRITDEQYVAISRDDLAGEFDITLSISTPEADNAKAEGLEFMLQTTGNKFPFEFTQMILSEIATLRKMPALSQKMMKYQPQPDPLEQAKAQLEVELLKAQVYNEQAKGHENAVDVDLKSAKTQTELAKARNLHGKSDKDDLDFVESESGVHRQHELDLQDNASKNRNEERIVDSMVADEQSAGSVGASK